MASVLENALHGLKGTRHVVDVRNHGLVGAVELQPRAGAPGARGFETYLKCFEKGVLVRQTGDIMAFAPAFIIDDAQIGQIAGTVREVLATIE